MLQANFVLALMSVGIAVAFSGGCGIARQMKINDDLKAAQEAADRGIAECDASHPGKFTRPVLPRIRCMNAVELQRQESIGRSVGNPNLDLHRLTAAKRLAVAERFDKGQSSEIEYELQLATVHSEHTNAANSRLNSATLAAAAAKQASAASAANRPVSCTRLGNTVNCY